MTDQPAAESVFSIGGAERALKEACRLAGLDGAGAELMRLGENALFRLAAVPVVARVARSVDLRSDVEKEVAVARWFEAAAFPAVRLFSDEVVVVDGRVVTFWRFVEEASEKPTFAELGAVIRRLHDLGLPDGLVLPAFDPFGRVEERLASVEVAGGDPDPVEFLRARLVELRADFAALDFVLAPGHIHGDVHVGNLMRTVSREVLLIDFERFADGCREWDLSTAAIYYGDFGWISQREYDSFVRVYGFDVMEWSGFPVLSAIRQLTMTTWLMQNLGHDPDIDREFKVRMDSLRGGEPPTGWRPF